MRALQATLVAAAVATFAACSAGPTNVDPASVANEDNVATQAAALTVPACAVYQTAPLTDAPGVTVVPFILATTGANAYAAVTSTTVTAVSTSYSGAFNCARDPLKKGGTGSGGGCATSGDAGPITSIYFTSAEVSQFLADASACPPPALTPEQKCEATVGVPYCAVCKCCAGLCPKTIAGCNHVCQ